MNENEQPLDYFGAKARHTYETHRRVAAKLEDALKWADTDTQSSFTEKRERVRAAEFHYDQTVQMGKEDAETDASELHDLAVIEAHLGGVAIIVEQPLTIGEKIEVHTA